MSDAQEERPDERGRRLFAYLSATEWTDYRAILTVVAGTYFSEFTPDDVAERLAARGLDLDVGTVGDRLESLHRWGNLAVSSSVGSPTSLADYYRRRNRYLITRAGQEVHDLVEPVLTRVDEVRDVSAGRLRAVLDALRELDGVDVEVADPVRLADLVRGVFDPHLTFTSEVTQFFAALNQWQNRYDLTQDQLAFFARILITYVSERLDEIERTARPIGHLLGELAPRLPAIVARMERGLGGRVDDAGLAGAVTVSHLAGSDLDDWEHLGAWFTARAGRAPRLVQLKTDAVNAVRTLTLNLTRLSRIGVGQASRRGDLVRLAAIFDQADPGDLPALAHAAFGLSPTVHYGVLPGDATDPVPSVTAWRDAPPAIVPVALRRRGERTTRGVSSPLRDRTVERRAIQARREAERQAREAIDRELDGVDLDGAVLSPAALHRLQGLVGSTLARMGPRADVGHHVDGRLRCAIGRRPGARLIVTTAEGTLVIEDLDVAVDRATDGGR